MHRSSNVHRHLPPFLNNLTSNLNFKTARKLIINMNSEAYAAWTSLYDDSLAEIFVSEENELKRVAMILRALKQEFSSKFC